MICQSDDKAAWGVGCGVVCASKRQVSGAYQWKIGDGVKINMVGLLDLGWCVEE